MSPEVQKNSRRNALRFRRFSLGAVLILAVLVLGTVFPAGAQTPVKPAEIAARVDHHYNALHSLEVHFVQNYEGMGMHRHEAGVLLLKKPGRMRWTYTDPDGKLFILDGYDGYFYSPGETEAQKVPEKQLDDLRSPLQFLLGHTELEKELKNLTVTDSGNGLYVLAGVPKGLEQRVASLKITVTADGTIRSMTIEETDGVTNAFQFSGEAENVPAPNSAFVFTPPPGVHVVTGMPPV
ncbi:MAG: outer membrane lipoprotein chaperone LolA [Acidobacteriaceae bacterium]